MKNATDRFIEYLFQKHAAMTPSVVGKARACLADYIAVTEAGSKTAKELWGDFLERLQPGRTPLLGCRLKTDARTACLVNGYNAHCLELDDGQRFAMIHLGASVMTALVSAASENEISTGDFLEGAAMGYEAACRLAVAIQPGHKKKGFHTAGTCGTVGAAVAVAFALKMNAMQLKTVLSAAVAGAAGMLEIQEQGSQLKPYNLGRAAMDGLSAAYMGFTHMRGPDDMMDGPRGFFKLFTDECDVEKLTGQTEFFEMERIYVKPYAACRHCHSAIEAAIALRNKIPSMDIDHVVVRTYKMAIKGHDHTAIAGSASAKLSIPYSVAAALLLGQGGMEAFEEATACREDILSLASKVSVEEAPRPANLPHDARYATVILTGKDGGEASYSVDYAKGDPENPMTHDEMRRKIKSLLAYAECDEKLVKQCCALLDESAVAGLPLSLL
ncbi:MAG: MmgE/PrpD family protein [Victivallales bacterium]|nr:MmgE/PrpD family protein [Victivallales bacterium]